MSPRFTRAAEAQIERILLDSAERHGLDAARPYRLLMQAVFMVLAETPARPGSRAVPRVAGLRQFALRLGRDWIAPHLRVGTPRHVIIYRLAPDGIVDILALVHDRMLLPRAARRAARASDEG